MKLYFNIIIALFFCSFTFAQNQQSQVVVKNKLTKAEQNNPKTIAMANTTSKNKTVEKKVIAKQKKVTTKKATVIHTGNNTHKTVVPMLVKRDKKLIKPEVQSQIKAIKIND